MNLAKLPTSNINVDYNAAAPSAAKRTSIAPVASKRFSGMVDGYSTIAQNTPSALPRSTASIQQKRTSYQALNKQSPAFAGKSTPSQALHLASNDHHVNKKPLLEEYYDRNQYPTMSSTEYDDGTVLGIALPHTAVHKTATPLPPQLVPELQRLAAVGKRPTHPASSSISSIGSPTSDLTSSSPWSSVPTIATTPISFYSASPNIELSNIGHEISNCANSSKYAFDFQVAVSQRIGTNEAGSVD
ncbi:hypothetical protein LTR66_015850 [Elasticomyces elasticus]|nr:hypothetical protein LTR66_015850 [Elasticomyces elasticus]